MATPRTVFGAKSDVLFKLVPDLRAAGISLYSSSTVVNVGLDRPIEPGTSTKGPGTPPTAAPLAPPPPTD
jgi:hypothetical protein